MVIVLLPLRNILRYHFASVFFHCALSVRSVVVLVSSRRRRDKTSNEALKRCPFDLSQHLHTLRFRALSHAILIARYGLQYVDSRCSCHASCHRDRILTCKYFPSDMCRPSTYSSSISIANISIKSQQLTSRTTRALVWSANSSSMRPSIQ